MIKNKIILSNIHQYKVNDDSCELLCYQARSLGVRHILLGPSSIGGIKPLVKQWGMHLAVSIAYPSGAMYADQKASEITGLLSEHPEIETFFVVSAVGRFLSGFHAEIAEEMRQIKLAAAGRKVCYMIEAALFSPEQMQHLCTLAADNNIDSIVSTAGFAPYKVPFPTERDLQDLVNAAGKAVQVVAGACFQGLDSIEAALSTGVDMVITDSIKNLPG